MIEKAAENIFSFRISLPDNPLKCLNCYVIKAAPGGRNLLIDTGFKRHECFTDLIAGMNELGIRPENTDVFITHFHSDHSGNAPVLQQLGCRIIMGREDYAHQQHKAWGERKARAVAEGMTQEVISAVFEHNPATLYATGPFDAICTDDGDVLEYGGYSLRCVTTPGHTPNHMCLYDEDRETMFLGDHVLFDITPNIGFWTDMADSLGDYMNSLRAVKELKIKVGLPAHRTDGGMTVNDRIDSLLAHHEARLAEAEHVVKENPGLNAYEIAGRMTWKIRARNWDEFPLAQKWFAFSEAVAHMDRLVIEGRIRRIEDDGKIIYE